MTLKSLSKSFSCFTLKDKLIILSTFIKHKIFRVYTDDPATFKEFIRLAGYQDAGVEIVLPRKDFFLFSTHINNKQSSFYLRKHSSDFDVFTGVIVWKEYDIVLKYFKDNSNGQVRYIVDVGSNIGLTAIFFNRYFPTASIICIEPDFSNYEMLERNLKVNGVENVITLNKALWVDDSNLQISRDFRDGRDWSLTVKRAEKDVDTGIKGVALNQVLLSGNIPHIDLLKIDIEGGEKVLFYDKDFLDVLKHKVRCLVIEIHEEVQISDRIYLVMEEFGFVLKERESVCLFLKEVA